MNVSERCDEATEEPLLLQSESNESPNFRKQLFPGDFDIIVPVLPLPELLKEECIALVLSLLFFLFLIFHTIFEGTLPVNGATAALIVAVSKSTMASVMLIDRFTTELIVGLIRNNS